MNTRNRLLTGLVLLALLGAGGIGLMRTGIYGLTLFLVLPFLLGGIASWIFQPQTGARAFVLGMAAAVAALGCLLFIAVEGLGGLIMCFPLTVPLAGLGSWAVYEASRLRRPARGAALLLLLPPGMLWDTNAVPPDYEVRTAIVINAPAERVWKNVVSFSELPETHEWYFRAGLAYPQRARIEGTGSGAVRYCEFSTGPFVEPIEVWDEPRLLSFRVTENPPPMREWSPYAQVVPRHLHGYLVSEHGQFQLTPLPGGRTLLEGGTWYRHGLWPAPYWRLWSDAIIHRIHLRVLTHIKTLAEQPW